MHPMAATSHMKIRNFLTLGGKKTENMETFARQRDLTEANLLTQNGKLNYLGLRQ